MRRIPNVRSIVRFLSACVALASCVLMFANLSGAMAGSVGARPNSEHQSDSDWFSMEVVGEHAARLDDIVVLDDYAYLAAGSRVKVLDVSDRTNIRVVNQTHVYPRPARSLDASAGYLVSSGLAEGGTVFDISDPPHIREIGAFGLSSPAAAVCADAHAAYAFAYRKLRIISLAASTILDALGELPTDDLWPEACAAGGGYVYATTYDGLLVVDVTAPERPEIAGWFDWPDSFWLPTDLVVDANAEIVLVAGFTPQPDTYPAPGFDVAQPYLRVIDVSDPATPAQVSALSSGPPGLTLYQPGAGVAVRGDLAYVTTGGDTLTIVDLAEPSRPRVRSTQFIGPRAAALGVSPSTGDVDPAFALVIAEHLGVAGVDVSDPARPVTRGWLELPTFDVIDMAADGRYAYIADGREGLRVVDLAEPAWTHDVSVSPIDDPRSIVLANPDPSNRSRYAFVLGAQDLHVFDLAVEGAPREAATLAMEGSPRQMAAGDGALYVQTPGNLVQVIDTSDPESPRLAGSVTGPACPREKLAAWRHHVYTLCAYAAPEDDTLVHVIDASDPDAPLLVGSFPATPATASPSSPYWLAVGDGALYVKRAYGPRFFEAIDVYDLSEPARPRFAGGLNIAPSAEDITVVGDVAYVPVDNGRLQALDVTDPVRARIMGTVTLPGGSSGNQVIVAGNTAVVAGEAGLSIVRVWPDGRPVFMPALARNRLP